MVIPQSLFRNYGSMRYGYLLGVCFLIYFMISIIKSSVLSENFVKNLTELHYFNEDVYTFYIVLFAYTCHNNLPDVFSV